MSSRKTALGSRETTPFLMGSLSLVWQVVFLILPLASVLTMAFSGERWFEGILPFLSMSYLKIVTRSLLMALATACICVACAYPFAYFLVFYAGRFRMAALFFALLPFWTNFLLHVCAWFFVLDRQGFLSVALQKLGLIHAPLGILTTMWSVGLMMVYFYLPFMVLPLYATLERFDRRLLEASLDLGASWWETVRCILLPLTMSGIRVAVLLVFIPAFGEFVIPEFMGGDRTMFVGSAIYHCVMTAESVVMGAACTLMSSCILALAAWALYSAMGIWVPRHERDEEQS